MNMKKTTIIITTLLSVVLVLSQTGLVKADLQSTVPVQGTLYSTSTIASASEPYKAQIVTHPAKSEKTISGVLGNFGDSDSYFESLFGFILFLCAVGLIINRRI